MHLVTAAQMRELDRLTIERYGTPGHILMERAGAGATEALLAAFPHVQAPPHSPGTIIRPCLSHCWERQ